MVQLCTSPKDAPRSGGRSGAPVAPPSLAPPPRPAPPRATAPGKREDTSLPTVMAAMMRFTASFFLLRSSVLRSCLNSWISPARGGAPAGARGRRVTPTSSRIPVLACQPPADTKPAGWNWAPLPRSPRCRAALRPASAASAQRPWHPQRPAGQPALPLPRTSTLAGRPDQRWGQRIGASTAAGARQEQAHRAWWC